MIHDLRYLKYVLKHKWFVLVAGYYTGAPLWRLLIHDWSKFTRAEWTPYVNMFFRYKDPNHTTRFGPGPTLVKAQFKRALQHHYDHSPHHWQHWIKDGFADSMPDKFVREMVADWMGAGRAINGSWDIVEWYDDQGDEITLTPTTRALVEFLIFNNSLIRSEAYRY